MAQVRAPREVRVQSTERLGPRLRRIVFGGEGLAGFEPEEFTDSYVKLRLPQPGGGPGAPLRTRTYTVRAWDRERRELTVDFVLHGDEGVAGPWAERAAVGDSAVLLGPGGGYAPDPGAAWHLMVGDAAVLPAIAASLPRVPAGRPVRVLVALDHPEDRVELTSPGELGVEWIDGGGERPLLAALEALEFPPGEPHAFIHGEAAAVRALRRHLVVERGLPAAALSASGYWKRSRTDEEWRLDKAEWKRLVEADGAAPDASPRR
jgi:NADPH-dependent ferric siderophore reductase